MYEEIHIKKTIDWKSAFIKLGVFFLLVIIICLIIFNPSKSTYTYTEKGYSSNLSLFNDSAKNYFLSGNLPSEVGNETTVKLETLINNKQIKSIDLESDGCNKNQSYSKITKIDDNEYSVYTYLECKSDQLSKIDTIKK